MGSNRTASTRLSRCPDEPPSAHQQPARPTGRRPRLGGDQAELPIANHDQRRADRRLSGGILAAFPARACQRHRGVRPLVPPKRARDLAGDSRDGRRLSRCPGRAGGETRLARSLQGVDRQDPPAARHQGSHPGRAGQAAAPRDPPGEGQHASPGAAAAVQGAGAQCRAGCTPGA